MLARHASLCRYGLMCITIDGKKHAKGSLEGGHRNAQYLTACKDKLAADDTAQKRADALAALEQAQQAQAAADSQLERAEAHEAAMSELQLSLDEAELHARTCTGKLRAAQATLDSAQQRCDDVQSMLQAAGEQHCTAAQGADRLQQTKQQQSQQRAKLQQLQRNVSQAGANVKVGLPALPAMSSFPQLIHVMDNVSSNIALFTTSMPIVVCRPRCRVSVQAACMPACVKLMPIRVSCK